MNREDSDILNFLGGEIKPIGTFDCLKYLFINNPDGSIRWIFPEQNKKPSFLKFYNVSSFKAFLIDRFIRLCFVLGMRNFCASGSVNLKIKKNSVLDDVLQDSLDYSFSIFTGTKGENRKVLIESNSKRIGRSFAKIAISKSSKKLVTREFQNLEYVHSLKLSSAKIPQIISFNSENGILRITDVRPQEHVELMVMSNKKSQFIEELFLKTKEYKKLKDSLYYSDIKRRLEFLNKSKKSIGFKDISLLVSLMLDLFEELKIDESYYFCFSHGDFTPWNLFETKTDLRVIDWELGKREMPVLYDFFNFIFQSEILINKSKSASILDEINNSKTTRHMESMKSDTYLIFYLLDVSSYYSVKFLRQEELHEQVYWLLNTWEEILAIVKKNKVFKHE